MLNLPTLTGLLPSLKHIIHMLTKEIPKWSPLDVCPTPDPFFLGGLQIRLLQVISSINNHFHQKVLVNLY